MKMGRLVLIFNRSSTPLRKGLILANGVGVVDSFYCGDKDEIMLEYLNIGDQDVVVEKGDRIAQGMIVKFVKAEWEEVEKIDDVGRGGYTLEK
jgi:dUTP pyrophosphatase